MAGKLYLCATPIGNLGDITLRVLETLRDVDFIAAEDTRRTLKLLNHFDIKKPLTSYFEHNKQYKGKHITDEILKGKNAALVSDAGTPVISDPGAELVRECIAAGIEVITLPGPCAAIGAVTVCGLIGDKFIFEGFLPPKKKEREKQLERIKSLPYTLVFYESPYRVRETLVSMVTILGDRQVAVVRELTKKFEQILRCSLKEAADYFTDNAPMGEFVLTVEGAHNADIEHEWNALSVEEHVRRYMESGMDKKAAVKQCALDRGRPKREIYNIIH